MELQPIEKHQYNFISNILSFFPDSRGVCYDVNDNQTLGNFKLFDVSIETHNAYCNHFEKHDPFHPKITNSFPSSFFRTDFNKIHSSKEYYYDFLQPNNIEEVGEIFVRKDGNIISGLSIFSERKFSHVERRLLSSLIPILEIAIIPTKVSKIEFTLTVQEKVIVDLIRKGDTNKHIANSLSISLSTVKTHIRNIFMKTDVKNRVQLLRALD